MDLEVGGHFFSLNVSFTRTHASHMYLPRTGAAHCTILICVKPCAGEACPGAEGMHGLPCCVIVGLLAAFSA